jgi:hypothetical protein
LRSKTAGAALFFCLGAFPTHVLLSSARARWGAQKLKVLHSNAVSASLRAVLSRPAVESQPAFNKQWPAFGEVFVYVLSRPTERLAVHKTGFFLGLPILTFPSAVYRQPKIDHSRLVRSVGQLWVTSQIAYQKNFIKISHFMLPFIIDNLTIRQQCTSIAFQSYDQVEIFYLLLPGLL